MNITGDAKAIAAAFIKARGEMKATVGKDGAGVYGKYATLAAIVEATTEILAKNGLAIMQEVSNDDAGVTIDTWLVHDSGTMMQFKPLTMPCDRKPQSVGSAATYGRRYALAAVCGLAADYDDDGEAAQDSTKGRPSPQKVAAPRKEATLTAEEVFTDAASKLTKMSKDQAAMIAALGKLAYPEEWDDANMDKLAQWASGGARHKLDTLYEIEATKLIKALQKKIADAAKTQPATAEAA